MDFLKFLNNTNVYEAKVSKVSSRVAITFDNYVPSLEMLSQGFVVINKYNQKVMGNYEDFKYLYKKEDEYTYILSNVKGDVYVEPKAKVVFSVGVGGSLDGEVVQEVYNYEELNIPTVNTDEGYEFERWSPEIPTEGKIEKNMTFHAVISDNNVYFHASGGGSLEGDFKQFVNDYSELVIPTPVADENYKFVKWMPEIPAEGKIDNTNANFYAVFESNIGDRISAVESDLTDTQLGLVENYDFTMTTAEEVTDLQLAMVEIYDLIMGGI